MVEDRHIEPSRDRAHAEATRGSFCETRVLRRYRELNPLHVPPMRTWSHVGRFVNGAQFCGTWSQRFLKMQLVEKFTDSDLEKLIEIVRNHHELFDTSGPDYMKTKLKDTLWEKIGKEFNTDGYTVKDEWRKLRDSHREALRRQQTKSGQKSEPFKLWIFQKQMEFLRPFMKNRATVGFPEHSEAQHSDDTQSEQIDANPVHQNDNDEGQQEEPNDDGTILRFECPKKIMKKTAHSDPIRSYVQKSEERAKRREEERKMLQEQMQREKDSHKNDALYQFFLSMYNITKTLPMIQERQVRRKLFEIVPVAEDASESEWRSETPSSVQSTVSSTPELPCEMVPMRREMPSSFSSTLSSTPEHSSGLVPIRSEMTSTLYVSPPKPSSGLARISEEYPEFFNSNYRQGGTDTSLLPFYNTAGEPSH